MPNDLVTQSRYVQGLRLGSELAAGTTRALRREAADIRTRKEAKASASPIRDAFGHGLITLGERIVGHNHPEPQFERAA